MKIVKGEWLLPSWLRTELRPVLTFTGAGSALWHGSVVLTQRAWAWLCERCDWPERLAILAAGVYLAVYGCWHAPHIARFAIPIAAVAWCVAACCAAPPVAVEPKQQASDAEQPTANSHEDVRAATLDWIWQRIGDRQGVHLRDLLDHAQLHGMFGGLDVSEFRGHLERWGIPVRARVRVRGLGVTVGVHRDDLPPPLEPLPDGEGQEPPDSELHPA